MADFRKMLFVLVALVMIIGAIPASAQVSCTAFVANQPILRQEGATEPAGDITLNCLIGAAGLQGAASGQQTLSLYVSGASITSRGLWTGTSAPSGAQPTEAALLVNDYVGAPNSPPNISPTEGYLQNGALVFSGFSLPSTASSSFTVRVTNIRVNANQLASGAFVTATVLATFPVQNQSGLVLGVVETSLQLSGPSTIPSFAQCTSTTTTFSSFSIKELIQGAFKAPNVSTVSGANNSTPGVWYTNGVNTESQTVIPAANFSTVSPGFVGNVSGNYNGSVPGQADAATRIRFNFSNIPAGVTVTLPVTISSGSFTLTATTSGDLGTFTAATTNPTLTAPGSVTYQVTAQSGSSLASIPIQIIVSYAYTPPATPNTGTILISATYAPTTAEVTSANGQIPRFADTSTLTPAFTIAACQTDLLFTFMTNTAGYDTGFAIANTSADPFGTANQSGTCQLNWYGSGPAGGTATTTTPVAAGTAYANLVSTLAPAFQGYMIAVCNFQYGHGFAFIKDGYGQPGQGLSQGYLASIIPTPGINGGSRVASDASKANLNSGEALNQ